MILYREIHRPPQRCEAGSSLYNGGKIDYAKQQGLSQRARQPPNLGPSNPPRRFSTDTSLEFVYIHELMVLLRGLFADWVFGGASSKSFDQPNFCGSQTGPIVEMGSEIQFFECRMGPDFLCFSTDDSLFNEIFHIEFWYFSY